VELPNAYCAQFRVSGGSEFGLIEGEEEKEIETEDQ
jgi:hypothetical protein